MKMTVAIVNRDDASKVCNALTQNSFMFTQVSSTGGFLRSGNVTLLIGTEDEKVDELLSVIKNNCAQRKVSMPVIPFFTEGNLLSTTIVEPMMVTVGGATVFVLNAERFEKM